MIDENTSVELDGGVYEDKCVSVSYSNAKAAAADAYEERYREAQAQRDRQFFWADMLRTFIAGGATASDAARDADLLTDRYSQVK